MDIKSKAHRKKVYAILTFVFIFTIFFIPHVDAKINSLEFDESTLSNIVKKSSSSSTTVTTGTTSSSSTTQIIYGGMAGTCDASTSSTCNSCTETVAPCNVRRIYPELELVIRFQTDKSDVITDSSRVLIKSDDGSLTPTSVSSPITVNSTITVNIKWSALCNFIGAGTSCATEMTAPKSLNIGIDSNSDGDLDDSAPFQVHVTGANLNAGSYSNHTFCKEDGDTALDYEGFCYFKLFKGDKKAYIDDSRQSTTYNEAPGGTNYKAVRFYYSESASETCSTSDFANVNPTSDYFDITTNNVDKTYYLNESYMSGLTNGKGYYFRLANVDNANNVFYFTKTSDLTCEDHFVVPEEVTGLLDGQKCFIATAAFGTPLAKELDILRSFRNNYLLTNNLGTKFVKWYYSWSPGVANKIKENDFYRAVVRVLLWPMIGVASLVLTFGLKSLSVGIIFLFFLGLFLFKFKTNYSLFYIKNNGKKIDINHGNKKKNSNIKYKTINSINGKKTNLNMRFKIWSIIFVFGCSLIFCRNLVYAQTTNDSLENSDFENTDNNDGSKTDSSSLLTSPDKGFEGVDEDGAYLYTESETNDEKEVGEAVEVKPNQENYRNGLLKTTSDGSYLYKVDLSEHHNGASLRMGRISPPQITIDLPEGSAQTQLSYSDIYSNDPLNSMLFEYFWEKAKYGVWSFSIGTGLAQTSAYGRFKNHPEEQARERYTFYLFPNHMSLTYKFQYTKRPWGVPYITGGYAPFLLMERRDDGGKQNMITAQAATAAAGIKLNIGALDDESAFILDAEYGIGNVWLDIEARAFQGFQKNRNVTSNMINAGVGFDF